MGAFQRALGSIGWLQRLFQNSLLARTTASLVLLVLQQVPGLNTEKAGLVAIPLRQSRWKRWLAIGGAAEALGANLRCRACRLGYPGRGACGVSAAGHWQGRLVALASAKGAEPC